MLKGGGWGGGVSRHHCSTEELAGMASGFVACQLRALLGERPAPLRGTR